MLPSGVSNPTGPISNTPVGYHMSWITQILPYLEQKNAFRKTNFNASVYDPSNVTVAHHQINTLLCPSEPFGGGSGVAGTCYAACHHHIEAPIDVTNTGVFFLNSHVRFEDIIDGTSCTIFVGEKGREMGELGWMSGTRGTLRNTGHRINISNLPVGANLAGEDDEEDDAERPKPGVPVVKGESNPSLLVGGFSSKHPGGANFAFGDGSVRFIRATISPKVFRLLASRADGELVGGDQY